MDNKLNSIELNTLNIIKKKYKLNIELASFCSGYIPQYILLDKTRNIHSYMVFSEIVNSSFKGSYFDRKSDFKDILLELLKIQYSTLDRPVFFIINSNGNIQAIECGSIREFLLENNSDLENIENFIINESVSFDDIIKQVKREL